MPKSLPEANPKIRTHPFTAEDGRRCRVVDAGEYSDPHLEVNGRADGPCYITGPEILKLSEQGRTLWGALSSLLSAIPPLGLGHERDDAASAIAVAAQVLEDSAATFDHNEPEAPLTGERLVELAQASDPERPRGGWEEPEPAFTPKFGERLRGIHASESNPQRDGLYVRTICRSGKLNPGVWYELTDGLGNFWEYPALSVTRVTEGGA